MHLSGKDLVAIPEAYQSEFLRDPMDSLIKYGCLPQRARSPWYMDLEKVQEACNLPSLITGPAAITQHEAQSPDTVWSAAEAHPSEDRMIDSLSPDLVTMRNDWQQTFWHIHVDGSLNRGRKGDATGISLGRILDNVAVPSGTGYRMVNRYVVPIVMQVLAPQNSEIHLTTISRFILQLRFVLGINITSFSYDGFESAGAIQELTLAGLVTNGIKMDDNTGRLVGFGKPWSVDRAPDAHQELKEAVNEGRVLLPDYIPLFREMRRLEDIPGKAPDHGFGGSKDVVDSVAGVVGYLATFGHAAFIPHFEGVGDGREMLGVEENARLSIE